MAYGVLGFAVLHAITQGMSGRAFLLGGVYAAVWCSAGRCWRSACSASSKPPSICARALARTARPAGARPDMRIHSTINRNQIKERRQWK